MDIGCSAFPASTPPRSQSLCNWVGLTPELSRHSCPIFLSLWLPGLRQGQAGDLDRKKRLSAETLLEDK